MPPLTRPPSSSTITLRPRAALVAGECDVLVVGGGPAALGAALGAAAAGADVILAERYGFLGGNATAALVMPLMSFHTRHGMAAASRTRPLMPDDHGPGEAVVRGALDKLLRRLRLARGAPPPSGESGLVGPVGP